MDYTEALTRAELLRDTLAPYCERIEIGGSIRRRKAIVKDIELIAIPQAGFGGMFMDEPQHSERFAHLVACIGRILKGNPLTGKYVQLELKDGVKLDLFTTVPERWGWTYLLRTGSREHNIRVVQRLKSNGYTCDDGNVLWKGTPLELPTELDVFKRAGLTYAEPQFRA